MSVLADLGYIFDAYGVRFLDYSGARVQMTGIHEINVGIIPKLNFKVDGMRPFSIGIGAGFKFPLYSFTETKVVDYGKSEAWYTDKYPYLQTKRMFKYPFIPYVKLTYETYFYVDRDKAVVLGLSLGYDFFEYDTYILNYMYKLKEVSLFRINLSKYYISSLTYGVTIGFYFGNR